MNISAALGLDNRQAYQSIQGIAKNLQQLFTLRAIDQKHEEKIFAEEAKMARRDLQDTEQLKDAQIDSFDDYKDLLDGMDGSRGLSMAMLMGGGLVAALIGGKLLGGLGGAGRQLETGEIFQTPEFVRPFTESFQRETQRIEEKDESNTDSETETSPTTSTQTQPGGGSYSESHLIQVLNDKGVTSKNERAMFLAQTAHESGGFRYREEIWGPTADQRGYQGRKDLDNLQPGDGYRFRGRGYIQLTGRYNYRTIGKKIGYDLENNPDLLLDPAIAAKAAWAFWERDVNRGAAQRGDVTTVTKNINGGTNGLNDRISRFRKYKSRGLQRGGLANIKDKGTQIIQKLTAAPAVEPQPTPLVLQQGGPVVNAYHLQTGGNVNITHYHQYQAGGKATDKSGKKDQWGINIGPGYTGMANLTKKTTGTKADKTAVAPYGEKHLVGVMNQGGIKNKNERAMFMAQMAHESGNFKYHTELKPKSYYEGNKNLANLQKGDGLRYLGRGYIQLTGRWNYDDLRKKTGLPLVAKPELAAETNNAGKIALQYWQEPRRESMRVAARKGDVKGATTMINKNHKGLADRTAKFKKYQANPMQTGGAVNQQINKSPARGYKVGGVVKMQAGGVTERMMANHGEDFMDRRSKTVGRQTIVVQAPGGGGNRPIVYPQSSNGGMGDVQHRPTNTDVSMAMYRVQMGAMV